MKFFMSRNTRKMLPTFNLLHHTHTPCELFKKPNPGVYSYHACLIPLHIQSHPSCCLYQCPFASIVMCTFHHQVWSTLILIRFANRRPRSSIHTTGQRALRSLMACGRLLTPSFFEFTCLLEGPRT